MIHAYATIWPNVSLGERVTVESGVVLGNITGEPLVIGDDAVIRSGTRIYGGLTIGDGLRTGHNALIRGQVTIGNNFHLGSYSSVEGEVTIGDDVKVQGRCEIADSTIGDRARLWVGCLVCDNVWPPDGEKRPPWIGRDVKVFARVTIMPGTVLGDGSVVAAETVASGIVPEKHLLTRYGVVHKLREQVAA